MSPTITSQPQRYGNGTVRVAKCEGGILLIALSRKRVKNAFSDEMYDDLLKLLDDATTDDSIDAVVLTGDGPYFSSGADLRSTDFDPANRTGSPMTVANLPPGRFMMALLKFPKLIAAAVNGPAIGIAVTLLLHCDLCVCSTSATFWAPFARLALVPEFCSSVTMPEIMGSAKANELLLLGKKIDSQAAVSWNLCSRVVGISAGVEHDADPFYERSLGRFLCKDIQKRLLSLPRGRETAKVFIALSRGSRRSRLERVCKEEWRKLDDRLNSGECLEALTKLNYRMSKL